jgi:hypothetical protein
MVFMFLLFLQRLHRLLAESYLLKRSPVGAALGIQSVGFYVSSVFAGAQLGGNRVSRLYLWVTSLLHSDQAMTGFEFGFPNLALLVLAAPD